MNTVIFNNADDHELSLLVAALIRRGFSCQRFKTELKPSEFRVRAEASGKYRVEYACLPERKAP